MTSLSRQVGATDANEGVLTILRRYIPASLVKLLEHSPSHDARAFAVAYTSDHDTPSLVWTQAMRARLRDAFTPHIDVRSPAPNGA